MGSKVEALMMPPSKDANSFGEAIYGAGTDLIRSEMGAYGEKLLGDGDVPLLDVVAYGGYTFSRGVNGRSGKNCLQILLVYSHIVGMLLHGNVPCEDHEENIVEMRSCEKHSSKRHYLLLLVAIAQIPLLFWLGNVGV
ncbi:hypothetical protein GH714_032456 [Hevea brasiliensis]|uniref:Uncharacterized protein n=1 Tax=Hevea brasiliensis TaxID=3981 RepID=A0A6A6KLQ0_HEVBR|nr:hypothetical protein GH714_032456 [Hevea brasiliensis]